MGIVIKWRVTADTEQVDPSTWIFGGQRDAFYFRSVFGGLGTVWDVFWNTLIWLQPVSCFCSHLILSDMLMGDKALNWWIVQVKASE